jgi:glycosyltransferase involved in cell wall biosynthesis
MIDDSAQADVYVFQRPTQLVLVDLIRLLRERGKTVVVDMDDDLTCIHPKNAAFKMLHPSRPDNNWQHAQTCARTASLVTVSTDELQRRYGMRTSRVLRNCVPRKFFSLEPDPEQEPRWGWAGALHSHPDDLPIIGGAVIELARRGHQFLVVGYPDGTGRALSLPVDPEATGRVEFQEWGQALTKLNVGVAPLANTRFNKAKSWLKPLEYAACGVPWVASGRDEYLELQRFGDAGLVVGDRTRDWVRTVEKLMSDEAYRLEHREACRAAAAKCVIEDHAWRWMETWETAWRLDHGEIPVSVAVMGR